MKTAELAAADAAFGTDLYQRLAGAGQPGVLPGVRRGGAADGAHRRARRDGGRAGPGAAPARPRGRPGARSSSDASLPASPGLTLSVVNTAWLDLGLPVRKEFLDQPVTVQRVDFAGQPEAARAAINGAVDEQTAGKITDLIPPGLIDELTRLVLVNAIYLKARWQHEFPPPRTRKESFYPERTGPSQADMMHLRSHAGLRPRRRLPGGPAALRERAAGDGHRAARRPAVATSRSTGPRRRGRGAARQLLAEPEQLPGGPATAEVPDRGRLPARGDAAPAGRGPRVQR